MAQVRHAWLARHQVIIFWIFVFVLAWAAWIPAVAQGSASQPLLGTAGLLGLIGAFAPTLAAVVLTLLLGGWSALRRLLARLLIWRVHPAWYLVAICAPGMIILASLVVQRLLSNNMPRSSPLIRSLPELAAAPLWLLVVPVLIQQLLFSSPMGEEIGLRGYALPRLQKSRTALHASIELGLLWGLWHLPRLWQQYAGQPFMLFVGYVAAGMLGTVATAVLFTWVYNSTYGSLLLVMLFHAGYNTAGLMLPAAPALIHTLVSWTAALTVIALAGGARLSGLRRRVDVSPAPSVARPH